MRPKHLAIELSKLTPHPQQSVELEQYATEGDLAAFLVLAIDQLDDLNCKSIVDIGSGNGVLGLGCAMIGASKITLIEADETVNNVAKSNCEKVMSKYRCKTKIITCMLGIDKAPIVSDIDIVVMNPPWGFQTNKADRPLIDYAFSLKPKSIYVLHSAKANHIMAIAKNNGYQGEIVFQSNFRLPPKYSHQSRKMGQTEVRCWRFYLPGDKKIHDQEE